jgi:hypothetical protein
LERDESRIYNNCLAGLLAEYCWKYELNYKKGDYVSSTEFEEASTQIDLITKDNKKIEVRSSFPRNGIEFALFHPEHQFDVIGPYTNSVKPGEIKKDYYVRTLYPINIKECSMKDYMEKDEFEVFLTGGATWDMMTDKNLYMIKSFIPEDEINAERLKKKSEYRVIPFSKALDTSEIVKKIVS